MTAQELIDRLEDLARRQGVPPSMLNVVGADHDPRHVTTNGVTVDLNPRRSDACVCDYL